MNLRIVGLAKPQELVWAWANPERAFDDCYSSRAKPACISGEVRNSP
jgi:hypothetical protein